MSATTMPLVDYTSDTDSSPSETDHPDTNPGPPPKKKPRTDPAPRPRNSESSTPSSDLPPLPATFHDLYASTVRTTTSDDPALHQGRTRQTPHQPGHWPSHVYVEWHPPAAVHALLTDLISSLHDTLNSLSPQSRGSSSSTGAVEVTSFLHSSLSTPQPLHISLSRPLSLPSTDKDPFLRDVEGTIRSSGLPRFELACSKVEWHRTAESGRSFLVFRVHTLNFPKGRDRGRGNGHGSGEEGNGEKREGAEAIGKGREGNPNPELTTLLHRCNAVAGRYGQPGLYEWATAGTDDDGQGEKRVGEAFHVSIAWSFAEPSAELVRVTERVFEAPEAKRRIQAVRVPVEGVKVKIGNVVTHVALREPGRRVSEAGARNVLGL